MAFDLKNNTAYAVAVESDLNIRVLALHPNGNFLFVVNEAGKGMHINLHSETVLYRHRFHKKVNDAKFSPNGERIAVCRDGDVQVFAVDGLDTNRFNPYTLMHTFKVSSDLVRQLDWSYDSRILVAACEDKRICLLAAGGNLKNFIIFSLAAHKAPVIGSYFFAKSYDIVSVDRRGLANHWICQLTSDDLISGDYAGAAETDEKVKKLFFEKASKHKMTEHLTDSAGVNVSACTFHSPTNLLVTAFTNGVFLLHEMPSFNLIHSLRVSELEVRTLCVNKSGDWLGIGCGTGTEAQLVVWEWQSETYVMKQQSHSQTITAVAYSPDGGLLATGAEDAKVKIWNCRSSFCLVTFTEHTGGVSGICWTSDGKAVLSCSLDGTVRAHDLQRYRNFRTLVCPEQTQLNGIAVDSAGDLVVASSKELYNIFIWSLENGKLLDVLSGHTSTIASIAMHGTILISGSWDKTLRVWNIVESSAAEVIELTDEALDVAYSPSGEVFAVLCLDSSISFFESSGRGQIGVVDTKYDVDPARNAADLIMKKTIEKSKTFTCICFSADGSLIIAGGQSNFVCMYSVSERIILRKFQLTINRSLNGVQLDIDRRNFSEFGNMSLIDASDSEEERDGRKRIKLAGTRHSDMAERKLRPEMRVNCMDFSPTGRTFAVCTTEGVSIYSLDPRRFFDPFELTIDVTPEKIRTTIAEGEYAGAIAMALRLNQPEITEETLLATPVEQLNMVARSLPVPYAERLLKFLAELDSDNGRRYFHFWQLWLRSILLEHAHAFKQNLQKNLASVNSLQQNMSNTYKSLSKLCDQNRYSLEYLLSVIKNKKPS